MDAPVCNPDVPEIPEMYTGIPTPLPGPKLPNSCECVEVYLETGAEKYNYNTNIYGTYSPQSKLVNGKAYFKKGQFAIFWNGINAWFIGLDEEKEMNLPFAILMKEDLFNSQNNLFWKLAYPNEYRWKDAGKSLGLKCASSCPTSMIYPLPTLPARKCM